MDSFVFVMRACISCMLVCLCVAFFFLLVIVLLGYCSSSSYKQKELRHPGEPFFVDQKVLQLTGTFTKVLRALFL